MKKILRTVALVSLMSSVVTATQQFDIPEGNLFVPHQMASVSALRYEDGNFFLTRDGIEQQVARYNVRGVPAEVPAEALEDVLRCGYFKIGGDKTELTLQWNGRVLGGVGRGLGVSKDVSFGTGATVGLAAAAGIGVLTAACPPLGIAAACVGTFFVAGGTTYACEK